MPVIVVTRLRLTDLALFDEFFASAVAVTEQAQHFVGSEPHLATMARLDGWCDEATFADWEQSSSDLPDWQAGYDRLIADGQVASLTHASDAHQTRSFPGP